jgi:hypothetical protein
MSHSNTILSQLLKLVGRHEFETIAKQHHSGQRLRKTSRWSQFVGLAFAQLTGRNSLRDIVYNWQAQKHLHYHTGCGNLNKTSLARLNEQQPASCYEALFYALYERCAKHAPKHGFSFKNPLYALDASLIDLSLKLFPWSHYALSKGAMKLQVGLDLRGNIPAFVILTEGKQSDVECAKPLKLPKHSLVICDRGHSDYGWFKSLTAQHIHYVTRQRGNARYDVVKSLPVSKETGVLSDKIIRFNSLRSQKKQLPDVRQVVYWDAESEREYTFITNHFELPAQTIADIYKQRWQVELFFKWIKQNLQIKAFVGLSKNAVMTQIWVAMCMCLLLAYLKFSNKVTASMQQILRLICVNVFAKRNLIDLIKPEPPPEHGGFVQGYLC